MAVRGCGERQGLARHIAALVVLEDDGHHTAKLLPRVSLEGLMN